MVDNTDTGAITSTDTSTTDGGVDIKALLKLATTTSGGGRVADTIKLYQDKLNIAPNSGVVVGSKYSIKVGGSTLIIYADSVNGTTTASAKTTTDSSDTSDSSDTNNIMLSLNKAIKNNTIYKRAVVDGKCGKTCKDYTITRQTTDGVEYILVDLLEYATTTDSSDTSDTTDSE